MGSIASRDSSRTWMYATVAGAVVLPIIYMMVLKIGPFYGEDAGETLGNGGGCHDPNMRDIQRELKELRDNIFHLRVAKAGTLNAELRGQYQENIDELTSRRIELENKYGCSAYGDN